jgi:cytochrome P450
LTTTTDRPLKTVDDVVAGATLAEFEEDPNPIYRRLRDERPVAYMPDSRLVILTTWELCEQAGRDVTRLIAAREPFATAYGMPNILSVDGPEHTEIRTSMSAPFRPRAVKSRHDDLFRAVARKWLDVVRDKGSADLATDLLEPISLDVIAPLIGLDDLDLATRKRWFNTFGAYLVDGGRDPEVAARGEALKLELRAYLEDRLESLSTQESRGDALWHLFHSGLPAGERRSIDDVIATVAVLIVGGFQEPGHSIAATLLGVLPNDDYRARLTADPETWGPVAFEEGLRWLPPFSVVERDVVEDVVYGDVLIPAGMSVGIVMGAANRDPKRWDHPDEFDLDRPRQNHMTFGYGHHFCLGHTVARGMGQVVLEEIFRSLPNLRLDPEHPPRVHGWKSRGPVSLPAVWDV